MAKRYEILMRAVFAVIILQATWAITGVTHAEATAEPSQQEAASTEEKQENGRQAMQEMQQMMPLMIQGMLNAMHQYYSNPEVAKIEAVHVRNFYEALIEQGFTPEEALQIVVGYGNPVSMGASK